jgi:hypothetical protein
MNEARPEFDRDEVIACMVIAFCLAKAMISLIYQVMA